MNERERAEALARAIDELIRGAQTEPDFNDEELRSLLRVASVRLQQSSQAVLKAADHETEVWRRLVKRLQKGATAVAETDPDIGDEEMGGAIVARRRMAEEVHRLAEQHRDEVWRRVQERIGASKKPPRKRLFGFLKARTEGDLPPEPSNRLVPTGDDDLDSLLRVALSQKTLRETGEKSLDGVYFQIQARRRRDPGRRLVPAAGTPVSLMPSWLRAGAIGVAVAMVVVALAPVPFTGIENSPAAEAARYVGEHIGVTETAVAPPTPGGSTLATGQEMTAAEAGTMLGLPLVAPDQVLGLARQSERLYSAGISGDAGSFVAAYAGEGATVSLYEEASGGSNFAAPVGTVTNVAIGRANGSYFEGGWAQAADGTLSWQGGGMQTLVFEQGGVRFTLVYTGERIAPEELAAAAAGLLS